MKTRRKSLLHCLLHWLKRVFRLLTHRFHRPTSSHRPIPPPSAPTTRQTVTGDRNQVIGEMSGNATAIGNVSGDAYIDSTILQLPSPPAPLPPGIPSNLPHSGAIAFVGREQDLTNLHSLVQQSDRIAITAIQGMGGIGKTELALQYATYHLQQGTYPAGVCWFSVRDLDLGTQLVTFARTWFGLTPPDDFDLPAQVQYCWQRWPDGDVLIVLDDVTAYDAIAPYLPPTEPRFKVLLTTRVNLGQSLRSFSIDVLSEAAALDLLRAFTHPDRIDSQLPLAKHLCQWLGYLPLGLEMVGSYLAQHPDLSLTTLQQRLDAKHLAARVLCQRQPDRTATHESVAAAFELSWADLNPQEQHLALILSLYALAPIPWELITPWFDQVDAEDLEDWRDRGLVNRSLLQRVGEHTVQLHQLLREFFRTKLATLPSPVGEGPGERADLPTAYCRQMVQIAQQIPQSPTRDQILTFTPLIPHLAEVTTTWLTSVADADLLWSFVGIARFYDGQGAYAQAAPWYERCLAACRDRLGADHPAVATSLNNLAYLYQRQGRYSEAEPLYVQALDLRQRLLGADHPAVATSLNNLAGLYESQGRYSEAEPLYVQALDLSQRLLGADHPDVATSLNNLAYLYQRQGRYSEAEPLYVQALDLRQRLLGADHPDVATSLNNLAYLYQRQGRYSEAEPLYVQALDLRQRLLGADHPAVATSLNNLAGLYESQGRYSEAEPLYVQALDLRQRLLGADHPAVATSLNNLAGLYESQGRYSEAEPLYVQALDLRQRLLGADHPDVATSLNNLAYLYQRQGRYSEAEPLYVQALDLSQRLLGADHPDVATSLNNLAYLYQRQGRYSEAEPLYVQALDLRQRLLGADHPAVATSLNNLAGLYESQGRYSEAEPLYVQALDLRQRLLGADHPAVATSLNNLAYLYQRQGRYSEAEPLYVQALDLMQRLLGADHPAVATSLNNLAYLYQRQGRYSEAEPLYVQALDLRQRLLGADHPAVATSLNNLAYLYQRQGRYSEAEPLYVQALDLMQRLLGADHPAVATSLNNLAGLYESQGRYSEAEPLYVQALGILFSRLGEDHPNTQTVLNNFVGLLGQTIAEGRTADLSDHPLTQALLQQL
ncbi:tetratricopeptide repeat protein [Leptodesmis sichuanensis]|uniref:tetratricopeptide repeat protein n=1 Tax=Leptodesmis sichuanensis TaxID=2906798 RepID=UPI001F26C830|nr:tetratricopeptide repeat protein [Leptodesmis sichuanensis]